MDFYQLNLGKLKIIYNNCKKNGGYFISYYGLDIVY